MPRSRKIGCPEDVSVPSCDDEEPEVACYPDWTAETTRIVRLPKSDFRSWSRARAYFQAEHGRIFENLSTAAFWAVRVRR